MNPLSMLTPLKPYFIAIKIGVLAAVVTLIGGLYHSRALLKKNLAATKAELADLQTVNEAQRTALAQLQEQKKLDEQTVAQLMSDLQTLEARDRQARKRLANLERNNADVRAYLSVPVPDALDCVFSGEDCGEAGGGQGPRTGGAARTVPTPVVR